MILLDEQKKRSASFTSPWSGHPRHDVFHAVLRFGPKRIAHPCGLFTAVLTTPDTMSAWSVKNRRPLSRHCRDTRVYGLWSYDYDDA